MKARIVVCASGEGSNFEALVEAARSGRLAAEIVGLVTNRREIGAIRRAERLGVPVAVLAPKTFATPAEWDKAMAEQLGLWSADWVVLAGFLALVGPEVLRRFPRRVVNSHPALLPKFGGPGMYGDRVHAAVVAAGERESGVTIHVIDEIYDHGPILAQTKVEVLPDDTPERLAARVKSREVSFYPKVLNDLLTGRITSG
jgi:phosphoribosylglycinamide formyltransferase-1